MFDNLSERLERSFKILKGEGKITEINVAETLKDVRKALLDADVNYKVAKQFTDTVKEKALGQNVLTAVKPSQLMVKIVHDELTQLMGGETAEIDLSGRPTVILMAGLQGSGKTTFSGKLARMLKTKKTAARCWWPATYTVRQPSNSCACWPSRLTCPCTASLTAKIPYPLRSMPSRKPAPRVWIPLSSIPPVVWP